MTDKLVKRGAVTAQTKSKLASLSAVGSEAYWNVAKVNFFFEYMWVTNYNA
jgi:hypothetical protein